MYEAIVWFHNHMYVCDYMTTLYFKMSIKFRDIFSRCGFSTFYSVFEPIMLHTPVLNRFSYSEHEPTNSIYQWYSLAQTPMIKFWMFEVKTIFISRCTSWSVISTEPAMWCQPWYQGAWDHVVPRLAPRTLLFAELRGTEKAGPFTLEQLSHCEGKSSVPEAFPCHGVIILIWGNPWLTHINITNSTLSAGVHIFH